MLLTYNSFESQTSVAIIPIATPCEVNKKCPPIDNYRRPGHRAKSLPPPPPVMIISRDTTDTKKSGAQIYNCILADILSRETKHIFQVAGGGGGGD